MTVPTTTPDESVLVLTGGSTSVAVELIHTGTVVRCDYPDEAYWAHGVVSPDRSRALFAFVAMDSCVAAQPGRMRLPGLDPRRVARLPRRRLGLRGGRPGRRRRVRG
jgi:hypothetical protein